MLTLPHSAASTVIPEPTTHDVSRIPTKGRAPPKRQRAAASGKTKAVATPRNTKSGASSSTAVGEVPVPLAASDDHPTEHDRNPEIAKSRAGRVIRKTARGQGVSPCVPAYLCRSSRTDVSTGTCPQPRRQESQLLPPDKRVLARGMRPTRTDRRSDRPRRNGGRIVHVPRRASGRACMAEY